MKVRTRIAPSPTGEYHIGHIRTVLYNYALAKKCKGQFILRIEDTDRTRYVPGAEKMIMEVIREYGLSWDEGPDVGGPVGPYVQTERLEIYKKHLNELIEKGQAYYCFCTPERLEKMRKQQKRNKQVPKYDRACLSLSSGEVKKRLEGGVPYVVRLKIPDNELITFNDVIRGEVKIQSSEVDDQILLKSDGIPTYQFAVVVDDHLMNITHVLRGEEWIPSMPKQVLLYRFFGWEMPLFAHLTVFLDPSGKGKMSKRRGSVSAQSFLDQGYLPEALLNFLMLLGWNPGTEREFFTLDEFVQEFSLENLHKKSPIFDQNKLDFFNSHYIREKTDKELALALRPFVPDLKEEILIKVAPLIKERIKKLSEAKDLLAFLSQPVDYPKESLLVKGLTSDTALQMLKVTQEAVRENGVENTSLLQTVLLDQIKKNKWNTGIFFMVVRVAICGRPITPPILESLPFLGKEETLNRMDVAIKKLR